MLIIGHYIISPETFGIYPELSKHIVPASKQESKILELFRQCGMFLFFYFVVRCYFNICLFPSNNIV
jgi:hypothetical protein